MGSLERAVWESAAAESGGAGGEPVISIDAIEAAVAEAFNVSRRDLSGGRTPLRINDYPTCVRQARKAATYLSRKLTDEPAARVGARFGFAASTVSGVPKLVERLVDSDPEFAACLGGALRRLQAPLGPAGDNGKTR